MFGILNVRWTDVRMERRASPPVPPQMNGCRHLILSHRPHIRFAPTTKPSVKPAIKISPRAPTIKGRIPCFDISRRLVRSPTPANVSRNAHLDRFPSDATCPLLNAWKPTSNDISRKPRTNFGNFFHRKAGLFVIASAWPRPDQYSAYPRTTNPIMALRAVLASTATLPAASEYNAPAAVASAVLSTPNPAHSP